MRPTTWVARTVGALLGKAQRYVADVKAEVNRQIELEQLQKMKAEFEDGAREVHNQVQSSIHELQGSLSGESQASVTEVLNALQELSRELPLK